MKRLVCGGFVACALLLPLSAARADVKLPSILGSHMVVQRDRPLPIWGTEDVGEEVTVTFDDKVEKTKANDKGVWKVTFPAMKADGKTHKITVAGKSKVELDDVLIGEVWIGSGQSNMEGRRSNRPRPRRRLLRPTIRRFVFSTCRRYRRRNRPRTSRRSGASVVHQRAELLGCALSLWGSLQKDLDVPVGLINSSLGRLADRAVDGDRQGLGRHVQRHDRAVAALPRPRRHLVSGRDQRHSEERPEVSRQDGRPDQGLAQGVGPGPAVPLRADRSVVGQAVRAGRAGIALGRPGGQSEDPRHGHGGRDRPGRSTSPTFTRATRKTWATAWRAGRWPRTTRRTSCTPARCSRA